MRGVCGTYGGEESYIQGLVGKPEGKCKYSFGTLAELHKVATRFVMLVCMSVCMEQISSHWMDFH